MAGMLESFISHSLKPEVSMTTLPLWIVAAGVVALGVPLLMEFSKSEDVPAGSGPLRKKLQRRITDRKIARRNSEPPADRLRWFF